MRLLGIDYGTKRIGLAVSDEQGFFAYPHSVITNNVKAINEIKQICTKEQVGAIVMGESLNYQSVANPIMEEIKVFKTKLEEATSLPVSFEREMLTSREAERIIGKDEHLDARAAALILKNYIDRNIN